MDDTAIAVVEQPPPTALSVIQLAVTQGVAPEALSMLLEFQERQQTREAAAAFAEAMAKFQAKCGRVEKSRVMDKGTGGKQKYANFEDIDDMVRPILAECSLVVTFVPFSADPGKVGIRCRVRHGTHFEESDVEVPIPKLRASNDAQDYAGAMTIAKRLSLCAALNIVLGDEREPQVEPTLSAAQALEIKGWIGRAGIGDEPILRFANVESLSMVPARLYPQIMNKLKATVAAKGGNK